MIAISRLALAAALLVAAQAQAQTAPRAPASAPAAQPAAPSDVKKDADKENAGKLAALGWLNLLDRKDWGTAYDTTSNVFRQAVTLGQWMDSIPKVREPFGVLVRRMPDETVYRTKLPGRPDGHYVSTIFTSNFEKMTVDEVVTTVLDADGRWRVTGYTYTAR